jgi:hypothetical protein
MGKRQIVAAGLLVLGVVIGFAGLFPMYVQGTNLASQADQWVPHVIYFVAWAASAALIALGGERARIGALLGLGTTIVTFGLFFADAGTALTTPARFTGFGLILSLIGWTVCAVGSALAFRRGQDGWPARPRGFEIGGAAMVALAALGTAIAFAPSWDSFTLQSSAVTRTFTQGDAFSNAGIVIAGDVMVMVALVLVAVLAALWRPGRLGAALLAGAIVPMAAQAISAIVQVAGNSAYALLGISPAQASAAGVTASAGFTAAFWLYCAFVLVMIVLCARMLITPSPAAGVAHSPLVTRPLAFPGSSPHTFQADGPYAFTDGTAAAAPYAFTAAGPQTAVSDRTEESGEPAGSLPWEPADAPAGEPAGTTGEGQPVTPPDGLPTHPGSGSSSG